MYSINQKLKLNKIKNRTLFKQGSVFDFLSFDNEVPMCGVDIGVIEVNGMVDDNKDFVGMVVVGQKFVDKDYLMCWALYHLPIHVKY